MIKQTEANYGLTQSKESTFGPTGANDPPILRTHKLAADALDAQGTILKSKEILIFNSEFINISEFNGLKDVKFIVLNAHDFGYCQIGLNTEQNLEFLSGNLHKIKRNLDRIILWQSLFDSVIDPFSPQNFQKPISSALFL